MSQLLSLIRRCFCLF